MAATGWVMDPATGGRFGVTVLAEGHSFVVQRSDGTRQSFDPERLRPLERQRGTEVYALRGAEGWRLGLTSISDPLVEARLPEFSLGTKGARNRHLMPVMLLAVVIGAFGAVVAPF